jgi:hypothetical protein
MNWLRALALMSFLSCAFAQDTDVPFVVTPDQVTREMLKLADVKPGDYVIDLGSGDGRIVITAAKKYGARGLGVDLDTVLLGRAREGAKREGVADRAQFVEENLFDTDLSRATVITTYLLPEMNEKLRPKILALKPGTRVVAHDYDMGEWQPDEEKTLIVPEKKVGDPGKSYVFFWVVPAVIAGHWESLVYTGGRGVIYEFDFDQSFQRVSGDLKVDGQRARLPIFNVRGDRVNFEIDAPQGKGLVKHRFTGLVRQDRIEGTVTIAGQKPLKWTAQLKKRGQVRMTALDVAPSVIQ